MRHQELLGPGPRRQHLFQEGAQLGLKAKYGRPGGMAGPAQVHVSRNGSQPQQQRIFYINWRIQQRFKFVADVLVPVPAIPDYHEIGSGKYKQRYYVGQLYTAENIHFKQVAGSTQHGSHMDCPYKRYH